MKEIPALHDATLLAVGNLGWDLRAQDASKVLVTCGINLWSWGETVRIDFYGEGELRVTSKCNFPLQCLDWGKNQENVEAFLVELNRVLEGV